MSHQREAAAISAAVRGERAEIHRALADGQIELTDVFRNRHSRAMRRAELYLVLLFLPRIGPRAAERVCHEVGILSNRRLGELTDRQCESIVKELA